MSDRPPPSDALFFAIEALARVHALETHFAVALEAILDRPAEESMTRQADLAAKARERLLRHLGYEQLAMAAFLEHLGVGLPRTDRPPGDAP